MTKSNKNIRLSNKINNYTINNYRISYRAKITQTIANQKFDIILRINRIWLTKIKLTPSSYLPIITKHSWSHKINLPDIISIRLNSQIKTRTMEIFKMSRKNNNKISLKLRNNTYQGLLKMILMKIIFRMILKS